MKTKLSEMTKKDYWLAIKILVLIEDTQKREEIVNYLIDLFRDDNPRFDVGVFKNAVARAVKDPSIIPGAGTRLPMARSYQTAEPSPIRGRKTKKGDVLYPESEVVEIVKGILKQFNKIKG